MKGRSFFGNKFIPENTDLGTHGVSVLEAEREMQEIRTQGTIQYAIENRIMSFSTKRVSVVISGIVTMLISYLLS